AWNGKAVVQDLISADCAAESFAVSSLLSQALNEERPCVRRHSLQRHSLRRHCEICCPPALGRAARAFTTLCSLRHELYIRSQFKQTQQNPRKIDRRLSRHRTNRSFADAPKLTEEETLATSLRGWGDFKN